MASFRFPMPRTFLYLMSLRTGTELIVLTLLFNKVSGLYGILALFTGFHLSSLQLSMYIYSLAALVLTCVLAPHIRKQSPLENLAFAWFYLVDSLINAAYTAAFGLSWFVVLAQHTSSLPGATKGGDVVPGGKMMQDTAGFTDPLHPVDQVEAIVEPSGSLLAGQEGVLIGHNTDQVARASGAVETLFERGSIASLAIIASMWLMRLYFILVVLAYARTVLHQYIATASMQSYAAGGDAAMAANPFAPGKELGHGWRGKLGRAMVAVGRPYWLGADQDGAWEAGLGGRFGKRPAHAPLERERRRRAGTGPSQARPVELDALRK